MPLKNLLKYDYRICVKSIAIFAAVVKLPLFFFRERGAGQAPREPTDGTDGRTDGPKSCGKIAKRISSFIFRLAILVKKDST